MLDDADMVCRRIAWWCSTRRTHMTSNNEDKVVAFPKTAEERKALRKAKQDIERQIGSRRLQ
jgi:hypothetical protein